MTNLFTKDVVDTFRDSAPELSDYLDKTQIELIPTYDPPFERLIRSIIYQQLSGKAASTIYRRFLELIKELTPNAILTQSDGDLKSVGLSRQKLGYVKNVANSFAKGGNLSHFNTAADLNDLKIQEIIEKFTTIKGVGEWTVQMYLIFGLGYLDIFPSNDLGVRKGLQIMYNLDEVPTPGQSKKLTQHWINSTVGTILCWRIQDNL